jgi:hypothetical protein
MNAIAQELASSRKSFALPRNYSVEGPVSSFRPQHQRHPLSARCEGQCGLSGNEHRVYFETERGYEGQVSCTAGCLSHERDAVCSDERRSSHRLRMDGAKPKSSSSRWGESHGEGAHSEKWTDNDNSVGGVGRHGTTTASATPTNSTATPSTRSRSSSIRAFHGRRGASRVRAGHQGRGGGRAAPGDRSHTGEPVRLTSWPAPILKSWNRELRESTEPLVGLLPPQGGNVHVGRGNQSTLELDGTETLDAIAGKINADVRVCSLALSIGRRQSEASSSSARRREKVFHHASEGAREVFGDPELRSHWASRSPVAEWPWKKPTDHSHIRSHRACSGLRRR